MAIRYNGERMDAKYRSQLGRIDEPLPGNTGRVKAIEGGDDFLLFEINLEWMVRFPRNEVTGKAFQRETRFLARFKNLSPVTVPDYRHFGDGFGAYPKIQGRLLTHELFQVLFKPERESAGRQLGGFLSAIHTFPVDEAREMGMATTRPPEHISLTTSRPCCHQPPEENPLAVWRRCSQRHFAAGSFMAIFICPITSSTIRKTANWG